MKRRYLSMIAGAVVLNGATSEANAAISLFDNLVNIDGVVNPLAAAPGANVAGFDLTTGLGTVTMSVTGSGGHFLGLFLDHELSESINTFFNEIGSTSGTPAAGQTWEIDEPGFSATPGDIYDNFLAGALDGAVGFATPDDVSMAMGWDFTLAAGQTATVSFRLADTAPASGFYLNHADPDSDEQVYFSSSLTIRGGGTDVPDGGTTIALLGVSVALMGAALRRKSS